MVVLFVGASLAAGRVWRLPFDDEIYTLDLIARSSARSLLTVYPNHADVHPPLSYLLFSGLQTLGLSPSGMRLVSLAMTAAALALFQLLALWLITRRAGAEAGRTLRLTAILLFGLCPLAVSQGDALRWYPLFAFLIALFVTLYLAGGNGAARLAAAAALGLAGSTNVLAGLVAFAFALYRYGLQPRFRGRFEIAFWLVVATFGVLGIYTVGSLLLVRSREIATQLSDSIVRSVLTDLLGFFGGATLGVSLAVVVVPAIAITALAIGGAINRNEPADPLHLLLLMLLTAALTVLPGFAKPRSFLYLAPAVTLLLTLYLDRLLRRGQDLRVLAMTIMLVATGIAVVANDGTTTHPFKRNTVIPYASVLDFVRANQRGRTLVVSTEPVVPWEMRVDAAHGAYCVSYFLKERRCFAAGQHYDTVVLIRGYNDLSGFARFMRRFGARINGLIAGRRKVAILHAGLDKDAALKTWLTGVPLSPHILTITLYR